MNKLISFFKSQAVVIIISLLLGTIIGFFTYVPKGDLELTTFYNFKTVKLSYSFCSPIKCKPPLKVNFPKKLPPIIDKTYSNALNDVPFHAAKAPLNKKPQLQNAGHYHRVGEIYLSHVYYDLGGEKGHITPEAKKLLQKAHLYLYALRPIPNYPYWSKALYQDAMVLELLGDEKGKWGILNLIGRVRSSAEPAGMAKLYLAGFFLQQGNCKKAWKFLNGIINVPKVYKPLLFMVKINCLKKKDSKEFINNINKLYKNAPDALKPLVVFLYANSVDLDSINTQWISFLRSDIKKCVASWIYQRFTPKDKPQLALTLCSFMR